MASVRKLSCKCCSHELSAPSLEVNELSPNMKTARLLGLFVVLTATAVAFQTVRAVERLEGALVSAQLELKAMTAARRDLHVELKAARQGEAAPQAKRGGHSMDQAAQTDAAMRSAAAWEAGYATQRACLSLA